MLKNICNYSALFLLSLAVLTSTVSAGSGSVNRHRFGPVRIENKAFSYFNRFVTAKAPQSYSVTVKEGQETTVKIQSTEGVSIKLYLPGGEVRKYNEDKTFDLEFRAAGEYVIEVHTESFSKYTLKASVK